MCRSRARTHARLAGNWRRAPGRRVFGRASATTLAPTDWGKCPSWTREYSVRGTPYLLRSVLLFLCAEYQWAPMSLRRGATHYSVPMYHALMHARTHARISDYALLWQKKRRDKNIAALLAV